MREYKSEKMRHTHEWVAKQLSALGYESESLAVVPHGGLHYVMLYNRPIFSYDPRECVMILDNGRRYEVQTGLAYMKYDREKTPAELADIIEIAMKQVEQ